MGSPIRTPGSIAAIDVKTGMTNERMIESAHRTASSAAGFTKESLPKGMEITEGAEKQ